MKKSRKVAKDTAVVSKKYRRGMFQGGWHHKFLPHLAETGNLAEAARRTGISRTQVCRVRSQDAEFDAACKEALEVATDKLEFEARKRAKKGSDLLMIFLLKALRPATYRETTKLEHSGEVKGGGSKVLVYLPDDGRNTSVIAGEIADAPPEEPA